MTFLQGRQGPRRAPLLLGAVIVAALSVAVGAQALFPTPSLAPTVLEEFSLTAVSSDLALAELALRDGDWQAAETQYARAIGADPASAAGEMGWARALLFQYRFPEAVAHARRAVDLAPRSAPAQGVLAHALNWAGQVDAAVAAARRSIELDPQIADGYAFLAESLVDRFQLAQARQQLERALALEPSSVEPLRVRAYLLETESRYEEAIEAYQAAIDAAPRYAHLYFALGNVYRSLDHLEEAAAAYRRAADLAPADARPITGVGLVRLLEDDLPAAIALFEQAAALDPDYSTAHGQLGTALYLQGNYTRAQEPLTRATQLERTSERLSTYRHVLGWTSLRLGNLDRAEEEFQAALALNPALDGAQQGLDAVALARQQAPQ